MKVVRGKGAVKEDEKDRVFAELSVIKHKKKLMREFYINVLLSLALIFASFQAFLVMGKRVLSSFFKYLKPR